MQKCRKMLPISRPTSIDTKKAIIKSSMHSRSTVKDNRIDIPTIFIGSCSYIIGCIAALQLQALKQYCEDWHSQLVQARLIKNGSLYTKLDTTLRVGTSFIDESQMPASPYIREVSISWCV